MSSSLRLPAPNGCSATPPTARGRCARSYASERSRCWPAAPRREGRIDKRDFAIDLDAATVTCPAGQVAEIRTRPSGQRKAQFRRSVCRDCSLRSRCLGANSTRKTIRIEPHEDLLIAARQALEDPATAEHLLRTRPRIERLVGLLAHRYGARRARYNGTVKAAIAGPLDRRPGQPQPDRPPADRRDGVRRLKSPESVGLPAEATADWTRTGVFVRSALSAVFYY